MEQRQYFPKAQKRRMRRERVKKWFSETFRAHSKDEYTEFFTRGFDGKDSVNKVYPWLYMRMLALCFVLFSAITFFMKLSGNAISFPAMVFLGALLVNLPFITLIYELCPKADISFLKLMLVLVIGGSVSFIISESGYFVFNPKNGYGSVAWTAFLEEIAKIIPAIAVILLLKKRNSPLTCFALAAAVGAGISIIEDMGYIFLYSFEGNISLVSAIFISLSRGASGIATHTVWVGYVGWIFSKCKKPLLDVRFYAVCLMSMVLHFLWDLTLANGQLWSSLGILFGYVFCICFTRWVVKKERRLIFEAPANLPLTANETVGTASAVETIETAEPIETVEASETVETMDAVEENLPAVSVAEETAVTAVAEAESVGVAVTANAVEESVAEKSVASVPAYKVYKEFPEDTLEIKNKKRARYSQLANIIAVVAAVILGITALSSCAFDVGYGYERKTFTEYQRQEFINYVQDGYNLEYDWERPLDKSIPAGQWYAFSVSDGEYKDITQIVDGKYLYRYGWNEPSADSTQNGGEAEKLPAGWYLTDISVKIDGEIYPCVRLAENLELEGYEGADLSCYVIREEVIGVYHDTIYGMYVAVVNNTVFYGMLTIVGYAFGMGAVFAVALLLFVIFKVQTKNLAKEIAAATAGTQASVTERTAVTESENLSENADSSADNGAEENSENGDKEDA